MKINAIVVLYDSSLSASETLHHLFQTNISEVNLEVVIWNNGPHKLDNEDVNTYLSKCKEKGITTFIYQDERNISLSKIYNFFIKNHPTADFYSIFDQDTLVDTDFFQNIVKNKDYHVIVPLIYAPDNAEEIRSPSYFNHTQFRHGEFNLGDCYAVGSCLTFSNYLVSEINASGHTCFNENYAFYRVDTEFFSLIKKFNYLKGVCVGEIRHNLSEKNDPGKMSHGKKLEIGYDKILSRCYNRNKSLIKNLYYCLKLKHIYGINYSGLISLMTCAIKKQHPRAELSIDNNITYDYSTNSN